jgi:hypothetical protein
MSKNYVIGFPRIGEKRELKKVLEDYWAKKVDFSEVKYVAENLRKRHWTYQKEAKIDFIASNDFSLYDNMLDTSILLGAIPKRFQHLKDEELYFAMARGNQDCVAMEMTKWFNTNYHYIVPEISKDTTFKLNSKKVIEEYKEALELGINTKINLIGAITYLGLSKSVDNSDLFAHISSVVKVYKELLEEISKLNSEIVVQFDEPLFVKDLEPKVLSLLKPVYDELSNVSKNIKIVVTTYFEHSNEATKILVNTPIWALGLDFIHGVKNLESDYEGADFVEDELPNDRQLLDYVEKHGEELDMVVVDLITELTFKNPTSSEANDIKLFVKEFKRLCKKYKIGFAVRMYIPMLRSHTHVIPTRLLPTAIYTEGHFAKDVLTNIMTYWRHFKP